MPSEHHVLISLEERHADNIFSGLKKVELRRRSMNIDKGTIVWIYVKYPIAAIVGKAVVEESFSLAPISLWKRFSSISGLTKDEFFEYFDGLSKGFAIGLSQAAKLDRPISLDDLRRITPGFHPPQFFKRFDSDNALLRSVKRHKMLPYAA